MRSVRVSPNGTLGSDRSNKGPFKDNVMNNISPRMPYEKTTVEVNGQKMAYAEHGKALADWYDAL